MYLKWINKLLHFCSFQTGIVTGKKKQTEFLQSPSEQTTALWHSAQNKSTISWQYRFPRTQLTSAFDQRRCSLIIHLRFPFVSYSMQVLFRVVRPLEQTTPSCRACRHSSPSSWLLRDGPCIPTRGPGAFIPAGRGCCPPACTGHIPCLRPSSSLLCSLPARALSSYSWTGPGPQVSAVSQDIPVQLWHTVGVHRPGQEVCKFLVPPGFSPVPWCPVFV